MTNELTLNLSSLPPPHRSSRAPAWSLLAALVLGTAVPSTLAQPPDAGTPATETTSVAGLTLPSKAKVEELIKETEANSALDEGTRSAILDQYRRALTLLESARVFAAKGNEFRAALEQAPHEAAEIRRVLESADPGRSLEDALPKDLGSEEIAQRLARIKTEMTLYEDQATELGKLLEGSTTRLALARARALELKQTLDQTTTEAAPPTPSGQSTDLAQATAWVLEATRQAQLAELRAIEQELTSLPVREELYRARRDQASGALEHLKGQRTTLEALQVESGKADAARAQVETEEAQRQAAGKHSLVQQAADHNAEITASLGELAERLHGLNEDAGRLEQEQSRVEEEYLGAQQRVEVAGLNRALGQVLIDQRAQLPDQRQLRKAIAQREDEIAELALNQIRDREEQRRLRNLDPVIDEMTRDIPETLSAQAREELKGLLEQRKSLLQKLIAAQDTYLRKLVDTSSAAQQLVQTVEVYDRFLAEHLLWVRSTQPVGIETLRALPAGVAWLFDPVAWGEVVQVLGYALPRSPLTWLGLLVAAILLAFGAQIRRALRATAEPLRRIRTDGFVHTFKAIGLTLIAALPTSILAVLLGRELSQSTEATGFTRAIGQGLVQVALGLYLLQAVRLTCLAGGLADRHFRWRTETLATVRRNLNWFIPIGVPLAFLAIAAYQLNDPTHNLGLARVALTAAMTAVAILAARLLNPQTGVIKATLAARPEALVARLRNLWFPAVVAIPLGLILLILLGYSYAAATMFRVLVETAWLAIGLVMLQQTVIRWLMLTRRRLALQAALERATARRAQAEAEKAEALPKDSPLLGPVEEPEVDLASLDEQTRRLVNTLAGIAFVLGVWWIWSDLLPALNLLDQIPLWHSPGAAGGAEQGVPVSVADVLMVLVIVLVTLVAAKNLPALIEIVLLQATTVTAGTRYAVKTLMSYLITAVAFLTAFGTLGLSWSQVQWLVAALSVGIGFGLQEIVANFISGIIILFERPVRVGDVVTIGDTTGVVTNIQIRATTIRNWDKQELLVPNKEFITGRLLNWTLTDQVNRITIKVGIEYGSDPERALALLAQVAAANPRVLKDPPPLVSFEAFGDNALTLVLRCYLETLEYRQGVTTELHRAISKTFAEQGVGIAFPQRDIHISTREPLDIRLASA